MRICERWKELFDSVRDAEGKIDEWELTKIFKTTLPVDKVYDESQLRRGSNPADVFIPRVDKPVFELTRFIAPEMYIWVGDMDTGEGRLWCIHEISGSYKDGNLMLHPAAIERVGGGAYW